MKLRVGLVGLGDVWEQRHLPALRALADRFDVRAVCEEVALRADQAARVFDAAAVDGYRALAARGDVDAILMLSPQWYGTLPILAACDAGKAVYCAAALDIDRDQSHSVKQRVEQSGIAFMAEFPRRLAPATLRLKELIATRLGPPQLLFCHHRMLVEQTNGRAHHGRTCPPASRNLLELIDWCRYVVGSEPTSVVGVRHLAAGAMAAGEEEGANYQMMSLDFSPSGRAGAGVLAQISCGHYMPRDWHEAVTFRPPAALQVCCERGIAFIDLPSTLVWFDEAGRHLESLDTERPVGEQLLSQFHRAVTSLVRNTSSLEDTYRAITILMAAKTSAVEGRRVSLPK